MKNNCIAIQVHIPPIDTWGSLIGMNQDQKIKCVELTIEHLRKKNPDTFIAFVGHGSIPSKKYLDLCDYVEWYKLDTDAGGPKMPAQYKYVSKAIQACKNRGFERVLKLRGDGLYFINNFCNYCDEIINKEQTKLLITQMTTFTNKMGDCIMYGDVDLLNYIWHENNTVINSDGLIQTAHYFTKYFSEDKLDWMSLLKKYTSFRDINTLKWVDLRWNGSQFMENWDVLRSKLLEDELDIEPYYWGITPGWLKIKNGEFLYRSQDFLSEKIFYN